MGIESVLQGVKDERFVRPHPLRHLELDDRYTYVVGVGVAVGDASSLSEERRRSLGVLMKALAIPLDFSEKILKHVEARDPASIKALVQLLRTRGPQTLFLLELQTYHLDLSSKAKELFFDLFEWKTTEREKFRSLEAAFKVRDMGAIFNGMKSLSLDGRTYSAYGVYLLFNEAREYQKQLVSAKKRITEELATQAKTLAELKRRLSSSLLIAAIGVGIRMSNSIQQEISACEQRIKQLEVQLHSTLEVLHYLEEALDA